MSCFWKYYHVFDDDVLCKHWQPSCSIVNVRMHRHGFEKRYYASPTSGEAYRDRRLAANFELWVEIFCVPTCFHVRIQNRVCPSVRTPRKHNHSFVNISPTLVIDTSTERSSRVLHHGNPKIWFFFQKSLKFEFWLSTKSWNHLSFVNISPTLVIDTSMERSSRVLHHGNPKMWKKMSTCFHMRIPKLCLSVRTPRSVCIPRKEITLALSISVLH